MPKILINGAISVLRKSVQKKGNFDIRDVNPEEAAGACVCDVCVCVYYVCMYYVLCMYVYIYIYIMYVCVCVCVCVCGLQTSVSSPRSSHTPTATTLCWHTTQNTSTSDTVGTKT